MEQIELLKPTEEYGNSVMDYRRAFLDAGDRICGAGGLEKIVSYDEWLNFEGRGIKTYGNNYVPSSLYIAVRKTDNKVVGIIDFRYYLSDYLEKYGGNIGYSVHPEERRKGYAHQMLLKILEICRDFGKDKVLIVCDKNNEASRKTILSCGGVFENEIMQGTDIVQRYFIDLHNGEALLNNLDKIHTTPRGIERIRSHLAIAPEDVVNWCLKKIKKYRAYIYKKGKNWYIEIDGIIITVNKYSYTIITAHKL